MSFLTIPEIAPPLPKHIWMLWLQGWEHAPEVVKACIRTWKTHHPAWTIHALSAADIGEYLDLAALSPYFGGKNVPPEAISDVLRVALLERHGGVWVDGTVYCLTALDDWLSGKMASGFFAFAKPRPGRMLSSWFLAARAGNYIARAWHRCILDYWAARAARDDYFWLHRLFGQCYESDSRFRSVWDATPEVSANGPHHYVPYAKLAAPHSASDARLLEAPWTPVLKLTHKLYVEQFTDDSVLRLLLRHARQDRPQPHGRQPA
jgi:hypothetical protein